MKAAQWPRPTWQVPYPYGFAAALDSAGTVAAPLLAGFSLTLVGLVVTSPDKIRWPNAALILLMAAAVILVVAIQCAYSARLYVVDPNALAAWWPDLSKDERWAQVRREQWGHFDLLDFWAKRFRRSFHAGLVLILAALAVVLVPPATDLNGKSLDVAWSRYLAVAIAIVGVVAEIAWLAVNWVADRSVGWDRPGPHGMLARLANRLLPSNPEASPPDQILEDKPR